MCRMSKKDDALDFIKHFSEDYTRDVTDYEAIPNIIRYYNGELSEQQLTNMMTKWDNIEKCSAYYYYGAYKKYFEQDYVIGNEYFARVVRTKIIDYSEYKFAENEIYGFTYRDPCQYKDFPTSRF